MIELTYFTKEQIIYITIFSLVVLITRTISNNTKKKRNDTNEKQNNTRSR